MKYLKIPRKLKKKLKKQVLKDHNYFYFKAPKLKKITIISIVKNKTSYRVSYKTNNMLYNINAFLSEKF